MKRLLITTADERSWRSDLPVLFLGEWCRLPERQKIWQSLDATVLPYHWDDRARMQRDYVYLEGIYESALETISHSLNTAHQISRGLRYWRILIGPWLYVFIHTLYDRWALAKAAAESGEVWKTIVLRFPQNQLILSEFKDIDPDSIEWSHYLIAQAIKFQHQIEYEEVPAELARDGVKNGLTRLKGPAGSHADFGKRIVTHLRKLSEKLGRHKDVLVIDTYLPRAAELRLQLAMGQWPIARQIPKTPKVLPDAGLRGKWRLTDSGTDPFDRFLLEMIPQQLPTIYLEGFGALMRAVQALPWPAKPTAIFTSNLFQFCEVFQAWAADKSAAGAPLVIGQHGGLYGTGNQHPGEDHQVKIADRFLTWGWSDNRPSIFPGLVLTNVGKEKPVGQPAGTLLLVTVPIRLVGYKSLSWPMGPNQAATFLEDQIAFIGALDESARSSLIVRINKKQDQKMRSGYWGSLQAAFPAVQFDDSSKHIEHQLRSCRLFVYACNSTGFLETLSRNIPTVIFWRPELFELRASASPYFARLEAVGIFHRTPESAAAHIGKIWKSVKTWWDNPATQDACQQFCDQYAHMPDRPMALLKQALTFESSGQRQLSS